MSLPKSRGLLRAFICSSKEEDCMYRCKHNTEVYAYLLEQNLMTIEEYRNQYDPHYLINDKIYNGEIKIGDKEYLQDKERRINNFKKYGKFEINKD